MPESRPNRSLSAAGLTGRGRLSGAGSAGLGAAALRRGRRFVPRVRSMGGVFGAQAPPCSFGEELRTSVFGSNAESSMFLGGTLSIGTWKKQ